MKVIYINVNHTSFIVKSISCATDIGFELLTLGIIMCFSVGLYRLYTSLLRVFCSNFNLLGVHFNIFSPLNLFFHCCYHHSIIILILVADLY